MENDIFSRMTQATSKYYDELMHKKFSNTINPSIAFDVVSRFLNNKEHITSIAAIKGLDPDFILFNEMIRIKIIATIVAIRLNDIMQGLENIDSDPEYLNTLEYKTFIGVLSADLSDLGNVSIFMSNPYVSNMLNMVSILKDKINTMSFDDAKVELLYKKQLNIIFDSIASMFVLFDKKCYSQAMSVFRQALEQYITIKALDMNKGAIDSFISHQDVTIKDARKIMGAEELDKYITEHNLTYNNYKSYLNYGWLDSVEAFRLAKEEKPKIKYSIKTVADITGQEEFYEAMDFASNYVHSNFVFVDLNWNMVISEVLDGCYQIIDWSLRVLESLSGQKLNQVVLGYYEKIKNEALEAIKLPNYNFYIR